MVEDINCEHEYVERVETNENNELVKVNVCKKCGKVKESEKEDEQNITIPSGGLGVHIPSENSTMTATHDDKTYVASFSLDERLKKTERWLKIVSIFLVLILVVILLAVYVKRDTVVGVLASVMGWVFGG